MSVSIKDIDFSKLPEADRLLLAEALLDSLHDRAEVPAEHWREIERRIQEIDSGQVKPLTQDEFHKKLSLGFKPE